ncbi:amidohydrolase family protein [Glutamicibacter sp. AOP12-B1-11]|uniref:amidohydrolase family protein n=1 Tax=Micrococcaceae TaxID=1268 RepID=UPI0021570D20|nr:MULTISPECIES: amidohydrolase family protein [unclassified Arthrobacter]
MQVDIGIHLHEAGTQGVFSAELIAERTRALGMEGRVNLSHAYGLGAVGEATSRKLSDTFAELDFSLTSVAPSTSTLLPLLGLAEPVVRFGLGKDGQWDYWSPYVNCEMLDRTWQLAFVYGMPKDEQIEHALAVAAMGGASIMKREMPRLASVADRPGIAVGDRADLVLMDGQTVASAVMERGADRTVIRDGRVVPRVEGTVGQRAILSWWIQGIVCSTPSPRQAQRTGPRHSELHGTLHPGNTAGTPGRLCPKF